MLYISYVRRDCPHRALTSEDQVDGAVCQGALVACLDSQWQVEPIYDRHWGAGTSL